MINLKKLVMSSEFRKYLKGADDRDVLELNEDSQQSSISIPNDPIDIEEHQIQIEKVHGIQVEVLTLESKSLSSAHETFNKILEQNRILNSGGILKIIFKINSNFDEISSAEIDKMVAKCCNMSVVIILTSENRDDIQIHWKSKNIPFFLTIKSFREDFISGDEKIYHFIADFLVMSLSDGHIGLQLDFPLQSDSKKIEIQFLADSRNYNLLMIASEQGNLEMVKKIFHLGILTRLEDKGVTAQSLALRNCHFDVIKYFLDENLTFPSLINIEECPESIKEYHNRSILVHELIRQNNQEELEQIVKQNRSNRFFYSSANESAAKVAITSGSHEMYEFLVSHRIFLGPHEDFDDIFENLEEHIKYKLGEINFKHSKNFLDQHLNLLITNSRTAHDTTEDQANERFKLMLKAFKFLNEIPAIKPILKVVSATKKFSIIFDFERDTVRVMNPMAQSHTQGLFSTTGRIYIGAKQLLDPATECEVFATLAHELCHLAMNATYSNMAKPYLKKDEMTQLEIEKISEKCQGKCKLEYVIGIVYDCYPLEMQHAELIVRVPHLMALYAKDPEKLLQVREYFPELFDIYENKFVTELDKAEEEIPTKRKIDREKKELKIKKYKMRFHLSIMGSIIALISVFLIFLLTYNPTYKFNGLSVNDQMTIKNSRVNYKNGIVRFSELFPNSSNIYEILKTEDITNMLKGSVLNINDIDHVYLDSQIFLIWENMTEVHRNILMNSNLKFQGQMIKFSSLLNSTGNVVKFLNSSQISNVLDGSLLVIGHEIKNQTNFYVEKFLIHEDVEIIFRIFILSQNQSNPENFVNFYENFEYKNFSDNSNELNKIQWSSRFKSEGIVMNSSVARQLEMVMKKIQINLDTAVDIIHSQKFFILSSEPGSGRTIALQVIGIKMQQKYPNCWVFFVDLWKFIEVYPKNVTESISFHAADKLIRRILKIDTKSKFERHLYTELFSSGRIVLLWNGYEDIAPKYTQFILNLMHIIKENTINIQVITARSFYSKEIRDKFQVKPYCVVNYDENARKEFLMKYFKSENLSEKNSSNLYNIINKIFQRLQQNNIGRHLGTPLLLLAMGRLYQEDELLESENLYEIYNKLIDMKLQYWLDRNKFSIEFAKSYFSSGCEENLMEIHQKYALLDELKRHKYDEKILTNLKIMKTKIPHKLSFEKISQMGILYINDEDEFEFSHRTFGEYFVARFLIEKIYNCDDASDLEIELRLGIFHILAKDFDSHQTIVPEFINDYVNINRREKQNSVGTAIRKIMEQKFSNFSDINNLDHPKVFKLLDKLLE